MGGGVFTLNSTYFDSIYSFHRRQVLLPLKKKLGKKFGGDDDVNLYEMKMVIEEAFRSGFDSSVGKEFVCNARGPSSLPGSGRSPGEGDGNPLQYPGLESPMDGGAWRATVHGVATVGHDFD